MSLFITAIVSQNLFAKSFGGTGDDVACVIIQTSDGGYVITGYTTRTESGRDIFVTKMDPLGNIIWTKTFGGANDDFSPGTSNIIQIQDGGFVVAGVTYSFGAGLSDYIVMRLDPDGNFIWARTYGGYQTDWAESIVQTPDGYVVGGFTRTYATGYHDCFVLGLDQSGNLSWANSFGGPYEEGIWRTVIASDGAYVFTANAEPYSYGARDILVYKLATSGSLSWARCYGGPGFEDCRDIIRTWDGGYAIAGWTGSFGSGEMDALLLKLDPSGNIMWATVAGGEGEDLGHWGLGLAQTSDSGYVMVGRTNSAGSGDYDASVMKFDKSGNFLWARTFGGTGADAFGGVIATSDGGCIAVGYITTPNGDQDCLVLKLGADGNYEGCLNSWNPSAISVNLTELPPPPSFEWRNPTQNSPIPATTSLSLTAGDLCQPLYEDVWEKEPGKDKGVICFPVAGGLGFISSGAMPVDIYSADGRLVYSGNLQGGKTVVSLGQGAYIWIGGDMGSHSAPVYKGKAVVR